VVAIRQNLWRVLIAERERRGIGVELSAQDKSLLVADRAGTAPDASTI
jgi:hypothetical protein